MRSFPYCLIFILSGILFPLVLRSQTVGDAARRPDSLATMGGPGVISLGFERNVNTFLWDLGGSWRSGSTPWRIAADERFQRTLIRTDRSTVKDEQSFNLGAEHDLSDRVAITASFSSFIFSDNRALALNDLSANKALVGVRWQPLPRLQVAPMGGVSFDNQQGIEDRGFMYAATARLQDLTIGRTAAQAEWYSSAEYIDPRFQQEHRGSADFLARFAEGGLNHTQLQFRSLRREFYLSYDSSLDANQGVGFPIESRDEQIITLSNTLQYQVIDPLRLAANVEVTQRDIARARPQRNPDEAIPFFDADIGEFRLNGSMQLLYDNLSGTAGQLRLEFNERDEVHEVISFDGANPVSYSRQQSLEKQKNNTIQQMQLGLQFSQAVSKRDTLWLSAAAVKMQYDTPSEENYDDRDELFVLAGLRWAHRFSPLFVASLAGDVNLRHTVFIFAERSANNTWNRVIRLAPWTELRLASSFVTRNSAEVVANYTVYDFESAGQSQRSFSLRQLTVTDSTLLRLHGTIWAELQLHLRFYERGELHWSAFTMRPLQYFEESTLSLSLLRLGEKVRAALGFRLFEQRRYGYKGLNRQAAGTLRSYGPTASMRLRITDATDILAEGWYQLTSEDNRATRTTPNVALRLLWNL
jgi:hypothetical protein